jgi:hypothetical protein
MGLSKMSSEVRFACKKLIQDLDTLPHGLAETHFKHEGEFFKRLRDLQTFPTGSGKSQDHVLYTGICMSLSIVRRKIHILQSDFAVEVIHYIDKILHDVHQDKEITQKEKQALFIFNRAVRGCCPGKDRRDYSKYAKVTKRAQHLGWSLTELYEKLCSEGGINALCGYFEQGQKEPVMIGLTERVQDMQIEKFLPDYAPPNFNQDSQENPITGPIVLLAYLNTSGELLIKKSTQRSDIINNVVTLLDNGIK